jgi:hypothetical protein
MIEEGEAYWLIPLITPLVSHWNIPLKNLPWEEQTIFLLLSHVYNKTLVVWGQHVRSRTVGI